LVADYRTDPKYQNDLAGNLVNLAILHNKRKEFAAAVSLLEQARPHHKAALEASPKNPTYRQFYSNNLSTLAQSYLGLGDHAKLAATADQLAGVGYDAANETYEAACFLSRCVKLAEKDAQLVEAKRKELAHAYADRGMAALRQAVARGYKDAAHMNKDVD